MKFTKSCLELSNDKYENMLETEEGPFFLDYLQPQRRKMSRSPNGFIFRLLDPDTDQPVGVIKFCNVYEPCADGYYLRKLQRFEREIDALLRAKEHRKNSHVVEIFSHGRLNVSGKTFSYYIMESAEADLARFLADPANELSLPEKVRLCGSILKSVEALHSIGIYHRDIKPGNFLLFDGGWKIADLGLIDYREEDADLTLDDEREKIGPIGYMSPEALNKCLGLNRAQDFVCIDEKSDVFQIAVVMGFILQGELLCGFFQESDMRNVDEIPLLYNLLSKSMQYAKSRRWSLHDFKANFFGECEQVFAF